MHGEYVILGYVRDNSLEQIREWKAEIVQIRRRAIIWTNPTPMWRGGEINLHTVSPAPNCIAISLLFYYRSPAVIGTQSHFTTWQLSYLCHLDLNGHSISSTANLHGCVPLNPFVRRSVRTVKEKTMSIPRLDFTFDTSTSLSRTKWDFEAMNPKTLRNIKVQQQMWN